MPDARGNWHLLVLGDSILWGQGLDEPHKIAARTAWSLARAHGVAVHTHSFAHSGAWIWRQQSQIPAPGDATIARMGRAGELTLPGNASTRAFVGERPLPEPYVWSQLYQAGQELGAAGIAPEVVLLDGGINNIGVFEIVNPTRDAAWMRRQVAALRGWMRALLDGVHASFPGARLVVTGYYPIFSQLSFALGADLASRAFVHAVTGTLPLGERQPLQRLVELSTSFADATNAQLGDEVRAFNAQAGARLAAFAPPRFSVANAYAAPQCLLWQLDLHPLRFLEPMDDAVPERIAALGGCGGVERQIGLRCSAGHPSRQGAARYHEAVVRALKRLGTL